jgi:hypothetical protein
VGFAPSVVGPFIPRRILVAVSGFADTLAVTVETCRQSVPHGVHQLPTAKAVGLSVDSRSNSRPEWTLDTSLTFNVADFRAN